MDMGEPVKIIELACTMIRLASHHEDEIGIVFSGLRPGEKASVMQTAWEVVPLSFVGRQYWTEYHSPMQVATGTVVGGKVVVEGLNLAEGEVVTVLTREPEEEVHLSPEEETELLEAIAEADRGDTISAEELFARLDRIR
jgi:FlaA1/EpsC-like NDP-sugar epimerase